MEILDERRVVAPVSTGVPGQLALAIFDVLTAPPAGSSWNNAAALFFLPIFAIRTQSLDDCRLIDLRVELCLDGASDPVYLRRVSNGLPFYPSGDNRVLVLTIYASDDFGEDVDDEAHFLAIPISVLDSRTPLVSKSPGEVLCVPWKTWGPNTRYLGQILGRDEFECASNNRILIEHVEDTWSTLYVLEFGPLPSLSYGPISETSTIILKPSQFRSAWLTASDQIQTTAPYRKLITNVKYSTNNPCRPYIGDQSILVMNVIEAWYVFMR